MNNHTIKYYIILVINSALPVIHSYEIADMPHRAGGKE